MQPLIEIVIPRIVLGGVSLARVADLRVVIQFRDIMCSVSPLKNSRCSGVLLLPLPKEMSSKRLGQLGSKHVSSGGAGGKGRRMHIARCHDDWL